MIVVHPKMKIILFKDRFVHSINIYKQYTKRTISGKCRAQLKKSTTYQVTLLEHFMSLILQGLLLIVLDEFDH